MTFIIQASDIHKSFKDVKAVRGVNINIKKGEFVALLGPNGAGKTTLVEMIEGIQQPDRGEIKINGMGWKGNTDKLHRMLGISFQETRFIDKLRVREILKLFASFYGLDQNRAKVVLELVGLQEKQRSFVVNLSGGQRQKLALGIALLNEPEILLLDEPTTGLDPSARREIWDILISLRKSHNTTLILTTHYMEEAEYLCDRIIIMDEGKILAKGTLNELLSNAKSDEIIEFSLEGPVEDLSLDGLEGLLALDWDPVMLRGKIHVSENVTFLPTLLNYFEQRKFKLNGIECRKKTLEDLFLSMTGKALRNL